MTASRAELVNKLLAHLSATTTSISLSGPNNFGKSTHLRQLISQHTNNRQAALLKLVYVDFNLRADDSAQAFYEVILRAIHNVEGQPQYRNNPALGSPTGAEQLYQRLVSGQTPFERSQAFLAALEGRLEQLKLVGGRLVLLLDEFDSSLKTLPGSALRHLRALKDHYPSQLIYLFATNLPVLTFDQPQEETDHDRSEFFELFDTSEVLHLKGLIESETAQLVKDVTGLDSHTAYIYRASGGHPGLTRLVARLVKEISPTTESDWAELDYRLHTELALERECTRLWQSLDPEEQTALLHRLEGVRREDSPSPLGTLLERGLVVETANHQP